MTLCNNHCSHPISTFYIYLIRHGQFRCPTGRQHNKKYKQTRLSIRAWQKERGGAERHNSAALTKQEGFVCCFKTCLAQRMTVDVCLTPLNNVRNQSSHAVCHIIGIHLCCPRPSSTSFLPWTLASRAPKHQELGARESRTICRFEYKIKIGVDCVAETPPPCKRCPLETL